MRVNTKQAVKLFFTNPSLEQVFKEAIANSLDANATKIDVRIFIDSLEKQETLQIEITDNGEGFTSERYDKFCELLKVEEDTHKGVGRLVYLSYFNEIQFLVIMTHTIAFLLLMMSLTKRGLICNYLTMQMANKRLNCSLKIAH